jgi:hypothetical protein
MCQKAVEIFDRILGIPAHMDPQNLHNLKNISTNWKYLMNIESIFLHFPPFLYRIEIIFDCQKFIENPSMET